MSAPCRFCGGRNLHHGKYVGEGYFTRCETCSAEAPSDTWESQPEDWEEREARGEAITPIDCGADGADPAFGPSDPSRPTASRPSGFNRGER